MLIVTVTAASVTYRLIETPFIKFGARFKLAKPTPAAALNPTPATA